MKKILCILLVILMCLTAAPLGGFAELNFSLEASAACAGGCSFTAQKIGVKYLKSESTCGKQAVYYYSCDICGTSSQGTGAEKTFKYGTAPEHSWGPVQIVPATCTEPETKVQTCTRCGQKYAKKGTGTGTGHTEKYVSNGDGTHTKICTKAGCDLYEVSDCSTAVTICGVVPLCDYCNTVYENTEGHNLTVSEITKQPTCTEKGEALKKCSRCSYTATEEIDALGHEYAYTSDGNATCTEDGTRTGKCIRCTQISVEAEFGSALGHSFTLYISNNNQTCTANATEWAVCDHGCGTKDIREIADSAFGHNYEWINTTADGYDVFCCENCGHIYTEYNGEDEHYYPENWTTIIVPTCKEKGVAIRICYDCNSIESKYLPKTGHIDNDGDTYCDFCDYIIQVVKPEEKPCDCNCHAGGLKAFFFKLTNLFAKIFSKAARTCACGKSH